MQASICNSTPSLLPRKNNKPIFTPLITRHKLQTKLVSRCVTIKATPDEVSTFDYSSTTSVFPAEACDTIGGEACNAVIYPEVKLKPEDKSITEKKKVSDSVDREYLEYNDPKTVFPAEACDDLGGEFCEPEYQKGVY